MPSTGPRFCRNRCRPPPHGTSSHPWAETDDLAPNEPLAVRLHALLVGIVDADKDGELSKDEEAVLAVATELAWSYLGGKGIRPTDLNELFKPCADGGP